jgi:Ulp1 family protease
MLLSRRGLLNDEIINLFFVVLSNEYRDTTLAFSTYWFPQFCKFGFSKVQAWTKKLDVFAVQKLLVPVFVAEKQHWILLCVDFVHKTMLSFDSFGHSWSRYLKLLQSYLQQEFQSRTQLDYDFSGWSFHNLTDVIPQQSTLVDCGVFICQYARCLFQNNNTSSSSLLVFDFSQKHVGYFRQVMTLQLYFGLFCLPEVLKPIEAVLK